MEWIAENRFLTLDEMGNNAKIIWNVLGSEGWTLESVSAMLGNMQTESSISPARWQIGYDPYPADPTGVGFGLVQWTPYTKFTNWAKKFGYADTDGYGQLKRIMLEAEGKYQQWGLTESYPISFKEFTQSKGDVGELAYAFLYNYEKPGNLNQPLRKTQARYWYEYLSGHPPIPPVPPHKKKKMPLWMYLKRF